MNRLFNILLLLLLVLSTPLKGQEKVYKVKDVPNIQVVDERKYTSDPENILSTKARTEIDRLIYQLEDKTGAEIAVVVLPSIGTVDCFDFSHELFTSWGIGKKEADNGLLILLVTDQRCVHFYTGYGLEGILPDIICKRIQTQAMVPYLRDSNWNDGMLAGVEAVYSILYDNMEDGVVYKKAKKRSNDPFLIIFGSAALLLILVSVYLARKEKRCPKCKKAKLQRISSQTIEETFDYTIIENTLKCLNCGHLVKRKTKVYKNNHHSGRGGGGPIIGGGFGGFGGGRGGFGGGGVGGGGFGGGRGGGGGAGTRF